MALLVPISIVGGLTIAAVAWLWLIVHASREGAGWGLGTLFVPPVGLLFALRHAQAAIGPLVLLLVGILAAASGAFYALAAPVEPGRLWSLSSGAVPESWSKAVAALQSEEAHQWMESRALYLQIGGMTAAAAGWIWLIVRGFRQRWTWGLGHLVLPPIGLVFAARHPQKGAIPLVLAVLGVLAAATPPVYTLAVPLNLAPIEAQVEGERHVTLTGADPKAASDFAIKPDTTVLQMANSPDVTDKTLESLRGLKALKELDLNDTQVTDAGLIVLRDLPALERLRLARTKVTDKGFREALFDKDSLMQLDLQGTQVSRETIRAWHDAKPGRRVMPRPD
jgi:hypothetical protein